VGVGVGVAWSVAAVAALAWLRLRPCRCTAGVQSSLCGGTSTQQQQQPAAAALQEMEWDNSAFNITVNPRHADVEFYVSRPVRQWRSEAPGRGPGGAVRFGPHTTVKSNPYLVTVPRYSKIFIDRVSGEGNAIDRVRL